MRGQARRIVAADAFEDGMAGDAEGGEPVQDRARKARRLGEFRLGMQRIDVAGEPVDQRHFRPRRQIADRSGARSGIGCGAGASRGGPPKPPSARQNVVCFSVASARRSPCRRSRARNTPARPCPRPCRSRRRCGSWPMTVPLRRDRPCSAKACSPCTTLVQVTPLARRAASTADSRAPPRRSAAP